MILNLLLSQKRVPLTKAHLESREVDDLLPGSHNSDDELPLRRLLRVYLNLGDAS